MGCGPYRAKQKIKQPDSSEEDSDDDSSDSTSKSKKSKGSSKGGSSSSSGKSSSSKKTSKKKTPPRSKPATKKGGGPITPNNTKRPGTKPNTATGAKPATPAKGKAFKPGTLPKLKAAPNPTPPAAATQTNNTRQGPVTSPGGPTLPKPPDPKMPTTPPPGVFQLGQAPPPPTVTGARGGVGSGEGNTVTYTLQVAENQRQQQPQLPPPPPPPQTPPMIWLGPTPPPAPDRTPPVSPPLQVAPPMEPTRFVMITQTHQHGSQPPQTFVLPGPDFYAAATHNPTIQRQVLEHFQQGRIQQPQTPTPPLPQPTGGEMTYIVAQNYTGQAIGQAGATVPVAAPSPSPQPPAHLTQYNEYLQQYRQQQQKPPKTFEEFCQTMPSNDNNTAAQPVPTASPAALPQVQQIVPPDPWVPVFGPTIPPHTPSPPPNAEESSGSKQEELYKLLHRDLEELKQLIKAKEAREQLAKLDKCKETYRKMVRQYKELKRNLKHKLRSSEEYRRIKRAVIEANSRMSKLKSSTDQLVKSAKGASSMDAASFASSRINERLSHLDVHDACQKMEEAMSLINKARNQPQPKASSPFSSSADDGKSSSKSANSSNSNSNNSNNDSQE